MISSAIHEDIIIFDFRIKYKSDYFRYYSLKSFQNFRKYPNLVKF